MYESSSGRFVTKFYTSSVDFLFIHCLTSSHVFDVSNYENFLASKKKLFFLRNQLAQFHSRQEAKAPANHQSHELIKASTRKTHAENAAALFMIL